MMLSAFALPAPQILADFDVSPVIGMFGFVFLFTGAIFFMTVYYRYRNTVTRHMHESQTEADLHDLESKDELFESLDGLSEPHMDDSNHRRIEGGRHGGLK